MTRVTLDPFDVYYIRENEFRKMLWVKCQDNFEFDDFSFEGNTIIILREVLGEDAAGEHQIRNPNPSPLICEIKEYTW